MIIKGLIVCGLVIAGISALALFLALCLTISLMATLFVTYDDLYPEQ